MSFARMERKFEDVCVRVLVVFCALSLKFSSAAADTSFVLTTDLTDDERYTAGKEQYELLQKESKVPRYSKCWLGALSELDTSCRQLTEDVQHHLAIGFTNCFLEKTGRTVYPCLRSQDIAECTQHMTGEAYNTYTSFFTHTQNICFYLQAQVWQEATENTITRLADSSDVVAKQLEDSSQMQYEMMQKQNDSIKNQEKLIESGHELKKTLEESAVDVERMMEEFKESTTEQKALIFEVFDRVSSLQSIVMGELTGFYSLIFYAISIVISYLLTSTPRANGARFWLFTLMTVNMVVERTLVMWGVTSSIEEDGNITDENTMVYGRLWLCRKVFTTGGIAVWMWVAYHYKDLNRINNQLLIDIQRQNLDLKTLLQTSYTPGSTPHQLFPPSSILNRSHTDKSSDSQYEHELEHVDGVTTITRQNGNERDEAYSTLASQTGYESDCETDSSESGISDHTFAADEEEEEEDPESDCSDSEAESVMTSDSGRWTRSSTPSMLGELRDLREATPLREMTPQKVLPAKRGRIQSPITPFIVSPPTSGSGRKPGRPKGSKTKKPEASEPRNYYLRSMRGRVSHKPNPIVHTESAKDFGRVIKHLAALTARNTNKVQSTISHQQRNGAKFFSSDED